MKELTNKDINTWLVDNGFKMSIKGFDFIREAIQLCNSDSNYLHNITKELYPTIAKTYDTTAGKVERAIRHSIDIAGLGMTNGEFVAYSVLKLNGEL